MQNQLKPCPFCGNIENDFGAVHTPPMFPGDSERDYIYVQCLDCGARGPAYEKHADSKEKALKAWNDIPRILKWQRTPPTEAGFYFYRNLFGCIQVVKFLPKLMDMPDYKGEWAGPIPEPAKQRHEKFQFQHHEQR